MNKHDFVAAIAEKCGIAHTRANEFVDHFCGTVTETLVKGEEIALLGFGTFKAVKRAARTGRNPKTGEAINIPPTTIAKFSVGKKLKDTVAAK